MTNLVGKSELKKFTIKFCNGPTTTMVSREFLAFNCLFVKKRVQPTRLACVKHVNYVELKELKELKRKPLQ